METYTEGATADSVILHRLRTTAQDLSGWLKFLGIALIVLGVPSVLALVGLLYIWLGLLLYKAGEAAGQGSNQALVTMLEKLKTYFIVTAVLTVLVVVMMILYIAVAGAAILFLFNESGVEI